MIDTYKRLPLLLFIGCFSVISCRSTSIQEQSYTPSEIRASEITPVVDSAPDGNQTPSLTQEEKLSLFKGNDVLDNLPSPAVDASGFVGLATNDITPEEAEFIADSVLAELTLEQKIGQLFITRLYGNFMNEHEDEFYEVTRLIKEGLVGGILFFQGDVYGQANLTNAYQSSAKIPLWVTQDMEFGAAMRVEGTTRFTPAMGITATGSPVNAFIKGKVTAKEAKALGVHQIFAPVMDVNNNPENPVINVRSFSEDPRIVAEYGVAFLRGVQSEGVIATAKHFPGHGDTDVDSHLALPVVAEPYSRLSEIELIPFRAAVESGIRSVMSAHVAYPVISQFNDRPSTLDPTVLRRLLTDSLRFDGFVVTDGLDMKAISDAYSPGRAAVEAFKAGADLLLLSTDERSAVYEMKLAIQSGEITEEALNYRVHRFLQLKAEHGLFSQRFVDIQALSKEIQDPASVAEAERIARESVTLLKNDKDILPIRDKKYPEILLVAVDDDRSGSAGRSLLAELRKYHQKVTYEVLDQRSGDNEVASIFEKAKSADLVIIGSFVSVSTEYASRLTNRQKSTLRRLQKLPTPSVFISFGNPYILSELPDSEAFMVSWTGTTQQVQQTVPALFGASDIKGRLPVEVPGITSFGSGIQLPKSTLRIGTPESEGMARKTLRGVDSVIYDAIRDSVFPGAVVGVVKHGTLVWNKGYGYHDYTKTRKTEARDVFDLASVTKVMATTTATMKLVEDGKLSLDDHVSTYIPEYRMAPKDNITIRHLLLHTSGLPPFRIYVDSLRTREQIVEAIRNEPLTGVPGENFVYSDLGMILLGEIIHQVSGLPLDQYVRRELFYPMGMVTAHFNPEKVGSWMTNLIPPTEVDTVYGRGVVQGRVHDERAYFMDGVAGHAGLFGSARDIAIWMTMLQNGGYYGGQQYLRAETILEFTSVQDEQSRRGLGFDHKSGPTSTAGSLTSMDTYGHTGFTGTSVWTDPDLDLTIILLSNRTWPTRDNSRRISEIRRKVADLVVQSIEQETALDFWFGEYEREVAPIMVPPAGAQAK